MKKILSRIAVVVFALILVSIVGMVAFLSTGAGHPQDKATKALESDNAVSVEKSGIFTTFTGPDADPDNTYGFVFYQGAKVESDAYAPLLHELAAKGWVCVTLDIPLNFAMLDGDAAAKIIGNHPEIEHWYVGGHSLGGLVASTYAANHASELDGLVMLGAFTTSDLRNSGLNVISVYGTNDTVLNKDSYEKGFALLPATTYEHVIEGGNHAQFGDYGDQKNDTAATITREEQVAQTVEAIHSNR